MSNQLHNILLIDDNPATNLVHKKVIQKTIDVNQIHVCSSGDQALEFLRNASHDTLQRPQLVFLDINMPGMSGWDFVKAYKELPDRCKQSVIIMMLTTSINPDDQARADKIDYVSGFLNKPLTSESLEKIIAEHFPQTV